MLSRVQVRSFTKKIIYHHHIITSHFSKGNFGSGVVKIGNVSKNVMKSNNPEFVPIGYLTKDYSQQFAQHVQWIMKKDLLGQDIFLIGFPGPVRRRIIFQYLEMTNREVEYVVLSRDTTESDLKQRREIHAGTAHYEDQSAIRAAIEGRVLVIDGVEKAERNVLPILNNLLENREVQLEDGRFLLSSERYDRLMKDHDKETLDAWKLVRVSENFRVIALGLPVPLFRGNPLDPPFRSRFQARDIQPSYEELLQYLSALGPNIPSHILKNLLAVGYTLLSTESASLGIPKFPIENIPTVVQILNEIPSIPLEQVVSWIYPHRLLLPASGQKSVNEILKNFGFQPKFCKSNVSMIKCSMKSQNDKILYSVEFSSADKKYSLNVPGNISEKGAVQTLYIENQYHNSILADMLQTHFVHDFCIIGNKGSGKSTLVKQFASLLNYSEEMVMLYQDMTSRDLLQQRITEENGDTLWRLSQLVKGALNGKLVILDGLHRLHPSTLSILQRLVHDRELQLYDGTRLLRHDRYNAIKEKFDKNDKEMSAKGIYCIHPSFRIIALAEPPKLGSWKDQWLSPELLSTFLFHSLRPLSLKEERYVIENLVGPFSEKMDVVHNFAHMLRNSKDESLVSLGTTLSTRQLIRIAKRLSCFPHENVHTLITQACLTKFLPQLTRKAMEDALKKSCIEPDVRSSSKEICKVEDGKLYIRNTCTSIHNAGSSKVKVPDILFYDNVEHIAIMEAMLQDFILGEHLLLIGNQGVGKNKIADRFLQLLNLPREYVQLHRDTTVQSLTQQPSVSKGRIVYEDSPLVRAVQQGHVLLVDEADKAPTHVTCILKALVESGEMKLSDGRSVIHHSDDRAKSKNNGAIVMHPDFRMIVLANRPGFPFLGNDFFAILGDIFSCHAVDNPSIKSEIKMLKQYGPDVPDFIINTLVRFFGELRSMSDNGSISYPYSTREVVNVVKHLQRFPEESLSGVLGNVFDFDAFNSELQKTLSNIFLKHGIPYGASFGNSTLPKYFKLPNPYLAFRWQLYQDAQEIIGDHYNLQVSDPVVLPVSKQNLDVTHARSTSFSEQQCFWQIPLNPNDLPLDVAVTEKDHNENDIIHIATANPMSVFSMSPDENTLFCISLSHLFPGAKRMFRPQVKIASLANHWQGWVMYFEKTFGRLYLLQPTSGNVIQIDLSTLERSMLAKITRQFKSDSDHFNVNSDLSSQNLIIIYADSGKCISFLDLNSFKCWSFELPEIVRNVSALDNTTLLLSSENGEVLVRMQSNDKIQYQSLKRENLGNSRLGYIHSASTAQINGEALCSVLKMKGGAPGIMLTEQNHHGAIAVGLPWNEKAIDIFSFPRKNVLSGFKSSSICKLPHSWQIIQSVNSEMVPSEVKDKNLANYSGFLEITDLKTQTYSYLSIPAPPSISAFASWLANSMNSHLLFCTASNGSLITVDAGGFVRIWEIDKSSLKTSLSLWHKFTGANVGGQLTIEHENENAAVMPKHGKVDPTGAPHVGGNMWAGGTGGRDTAGLGGKGGPYRLDAGHAVFQLSDHEKNAVPLEVQKAAREMAQKAYKEKLKEIEMSEYDAKLYEQFSNNIQKQVQILRVILDGLQAKSKERQWLKHQASGELDDTKLVEGLAGEKSIYKRRGEQEPELGSPQEKPKRLRLIVDISGSMYRFNGHDQRLERQLESVVMVMEAFEGYSDKFQYDIIGHSGEDYCLEFSTFDNPPKNNKERLTVLKKMYAHSQYCISGDNTLKATQHAVETIATEEADECFVIVLSDANFDRYGISPTTFGSLLVSNSKVNAFAIFIGSLGNQADRLSISLPAGRGFVCLDTQTLPQILQQIFTSALLIDV